MFLCDPTSNMLDVTQIDSEPRCRSSSKVCIDVYLQPSMDAANRATER
jgi:hypothetical protein